MASTRDIRTNQLDISCDVCGRTLLRGERAEPYLAGGQRRQVCELCTVRAQHEGWIREGGGDEPTLRTTTREGRGRSFLDRLRARRERARELAEDEAAAALGDEREPVRDAEAPREPRHVRAIPTNNELKMQRALEVFNASDHTRTVGGIARSLGAPAVSVRPLPQQPSVVGITVMWELSWYRYEIDLSDEAGGVRRVAQGTELTELDDGEHEVNAAADERGALYLGGTG